MSRTCDANLMSYALLATAFLCNFHFMYEDTWRYIDFSFNAALHTLESLTPRTWRPPPARWCQSYLTIRVGSGMCKLIPVAIKIGMHRISTGAGFCTPGLYIYIYPPGRCFIKVLYTSWVLGKTIMFGSLTWDFCFCLGICLQIQNAFTLWLDPNLGCCFL